MQSAAQNITNYLTSRLTLQISFDLPLEILRYILYTVIIIGFQVGILPKGATPRRCSTRKLFNSIRCLPYALHILQYIPLHHSQGCILIHSFNSKHYFTSLAVGSRRLITTVESPQTWRHHHHNGLTYHRWRTGVKHNSNQVDDRPRKFKCVLSFLLKSAPSAQML
jgi:hypothetical protein